VASIPLKTRRWLSRIAGLLAIGVRAHFDGLFLSRAVAHPGLAEAWVVNEPVAKADAIVILGGGLENRPFAAARLFHDGVAPKILYMDVQPGPAEELGVAPTEKEVTRRILLSNNVPESALLAIGTNVASTYDESQAVRAWVKADRRDLDRHHHRTVSHPPRPLDFSPRTPGYAGKNLRQRRGSGSL
jgi:uncharacterized SAM-binding protein YcdF (DUF218 family)